MRITGHDFGTNPCSMTIEVQTPMDGERNRIAELREAAGLTQEQLAERVGTSNVQISRLERGDRRLTVGWMRRIAPHLGVNPTDLITEEAVGARIAVRALRKRARLSMAQLASVVGLAGPSSWQGYEDNLTKRHFLPMEWREPLSRLMVGEGAPPITQAEVDALFMEAREEAPQRKPGYIINLAPGPEMLELLAKRPKPGEGIKMAPILISRQAVREAETIVAQAGPLNAAPRDIVRRLFTEVLGLAIEGEP